MSPRTSLLTAAAVAAATLGSSSPLGAQPVPPAAPPGPSRPAPAATPSASAQPAGPAAAGDKERARALHDEGLRAYEAGEYGRAITAYRKAYALVPAPGILFNLAQAYRLRGDCRRANRAYRTFLHAAPSSPEASVAREHMRALRTCVERSQKGDADRQPAAPTGVAATAAGSAAAGAGSAAATPSSPPPPSAGASSAGAPSSAPSGTQIGSGSPADAPALATPAPAAGDAIQAGPGGGLGGPERDVEAGQNKKLFGLGAGAAGAALLAVGVYYGLQARSEASDLNEFYDAGGMWTPQLASREDALHSDRTLAIGFTLVGAGAMGAGAVLYWMGHKEARAAEVRARARAQVSVTPQPGGASVIWHGSF